MMLYLERATIQPLRVTAVDLQHPARQWSVSLCPRLLEAAAVDEFEEVSVQNLTTGARFLTFALAGGIGEVRLNGTAAYLAKPGETLAIGVPARKDAGELEPEGIIFVWVDEGDNSPRMIDRRERPVPDRPRETFTD